MTNIILNTQFSAIHCWPDCGIPEMKYLKHPHRHVFHIRMKWEVNHDNRDIEFIQQKEKVEHYIREQWLNKNLGQMSCESIAKTFGVYWKADYVRCMEDNENGAEWMKEEEK